MAPVRLTRSTTRAETGTPLDVIFAGVLMAMAWAFAGYLGVRLFDPKSDLDTTLVILAMITAYQVCAVAIAARARTARHRSRP